MNESLFSGDKVFSVSEINSLLKDMLESSFPQICIEGEISNYRPNSSGHLYFTLKDEASQISAVMFRSAAAHIDFVPKDGTKVQCTGRLTVYPARGNYQILITRMTVSGEGAILKMIEERKRRLAAEGLFDEAKKRPLPPFPQTIGIITSPTGAALRDILQIMRRRNKCVSAIVFPSLVQGDGAADSIVHQIKNANALKKCDVLIVGRGGGSLEDLLPFSDENVVRTIAESEIPVISAVGHEIDWALSDFAADKRAPTPSAAAELAVPQLSDIFNMILFYKNELHQNIDSHVKNAKLMIQSFSPENLELKFRSIEQPLLQRFDYMKDEIYDGMVQKIRDARVLIENFRLILENASPQAIFERGYSMVRDKNTQQIIRDGKQAAIGAEIEIIPAKGKIIARVEERQ
ncbi:MAG: exodeoxyribonuclease VII large subunit [Treponema sp.]